MTAVRSGWAALASLGLLAGCGGSRDAAVADTTSTSPAAPPALPDSLVLQAPGGVTVWFTVARQARDSSGTTCLERALEVRSATMRRGVPLLYTLEAPALLDDTTMRAVLYSGCRAGPAYRVDFETVSPRRISP